MGELLQQWEGLRHKYGKQDEVTIPEAGVIALYDHAAALEAENERLWDSAVNMGCDCGSFGYPDPREHDENCWYVWFSQDVAARRQKAALKEDEDVRT